MKVVDLDFYRRKKQVQDLEKKVSELATQHPHGARQLKTCFTEWLIKTGSLQ